jgi:hypothetical protein
VFSANIIASAWILQYLESEDDDEKDGKWNNKHRLAQRLGEFWKTQDVQLMITVLQSRYW